MKKMIFKVFILSLICIIAAVAFSELLMFIGHATGLRKSDTISRDLFFIFNILSVVGGLTLFAILINRLFVRRIKKLNTAVNHVTKGNYDIQLNDTGKDELSVLTADFNTMALELRSNEYLNKEFVRNFSHEIKTPVSSIKGYADLMKSGTLSTEEVQEYSEIISQESARLFELSRQMLSLSLVESKSIIKRDERFKPSEQITKILLLIQKEWQKKNIDMDVDMDECEITGNEELTYLVWQNLISNAVKYTDENGEIKIRLYTENERLKFEIMNTGGGISENDQPYIFNAFYTSNKSRSGKSTGLGLAIVKTILDKLGGSIRCHSEENKGTTFFVEM